MNVSSWRPVRQTVELSRWHRPKVSARTSQKLSFHRNRDVTIIIGADRKYRLHDLQNPDITPRRTTASGAFKSEDDRPCVKQLVLAIVLRNFCLERVGQTIVWRITIAVVPPSTVSRQIGGVLDA
jgi:hypothetical protein